MRYHNLLIILIVCICCGALFGADLPVPYDQSQPATAVKIPGHWQDNGDNTATWIPESWRIVQQQAQQPVQQVVYVQQPAQQVIYVPERPAFRATVSLGGYGGYSRSCTGYRPSCSSQQPIIYHWATYGHQQLR
jgi:hypothetical protein